MSSKKLLVWAVAIAAAALIGGRMYAARAMPPPPIDRAGKDLSAAPARPLSYKPGIAHDLPGPITTALSHHRQIGNDHSGKFRFRGQSGQANRRRAIS